MFRFVGLCFGMLVRFFRERRSLLLENLALRQQLVALKRRHPRPSLGLFDKLFWVIARWVWSAWKHSLILVTPETVVRWHRTGFRIYWQLISRVRRPVGRRPTPKELRELIFRMVVENPTWGAPRIHGELRMLGFELSERTISRWMKRAPRDPDRAKRWLAFLRNHREAIAAMGFFTAARITFGVLYCFFVISHDRRRVLHTNVTKHPTSGWITEQLREAFPLEASVCHPQPHSSLPDISTHWQLNGREAGSLSPNLRALSVAGVSLPPPSSRRRPVAESLALRDRARRESPPPTSGPTRLARQNSCGSPKLQPRPKTVRFLVE
jgi:hypothetical protein